jgi:hypothetical protein
MTDSGRPLRGMMNCFVFWVEGWDTGTREIHMPPAKHVGATLSAGVDLCE